MSDGKNHELPQANHTAERCRQLELEVQKLTAQLEQARQRLQDLEKERADLESAYAECKQVLSEKTGIEFFTFTREEMEEMERSGPSLDAVIQELEKQMGG